MIADRRASCICEVTTGTPRYGVSAHCHKCRPELYYIGQATAYSDLNVVIGHVAIVDQSTRPPQDKKIGKNYHSHKFAGVGRKHYQQ